MESNSIKIAIKNKEYVIKLNEGESIYLELTNKNDNIYLSDVPKKNNENMYEEDVFEDLSKIKLEPISKTYNSNSEVNKDSYQSAIFDVLNERVNIEESEKTKVLLDESGRKEDIENEILEESKGETEANNEQDEFTEIDQKEYEVLEVVEDDSEEENDSYENFKSRYLDFDEE